MKNNKKIIIVDILIFFLNDLLGWGVVIMFDSTGFDCKFQNLSLHRVLLIIGIAHIIISILFSVFFYKKERTKYAIKIGDGLFIYNLIMSVLPYAYLAFASLIS